MLAEVLIARGENNLSIPIAEITQPMVSPSFTETISPNPRLMIDSMKTISLNRSDTKLVGRVAEKTSSLATAIGIGTFSKGSERLSHRRRGRRPRCPHGKRKDDSSHQCGDKKLGLTPYIKLPA